MHFNDLGDDPEDARHSLAERAAAASRSTWVSVGVNMVLTIGQISAGILSKSQGLIADGIHSLSDLIADFVVLFASHHSKKDAGEEHPYGHQRFATAASLALGAILLVVGVGMIWSAITKLQAPETVPQVHISALWVVGSARLPRNCCFATCWPWPSASSRACWWPMHGMPGRTRPHRWSWVSASSATWRVTRSWTRLPR